METHVREPVLQSHKVEETENPDQKQAVPMNSLQDQVCLLWLQSTF